MGLSQLNSLYREVILDHSDHPHNKHALSAVTNTITLKNPTCGDVINLDVQVDDAGTITDAVKGKSREQALAMAKTFSDMVMGKSHSQADLDQLEDAAILSSIMQFPARIKCATLAWWALQRALLSDAKKEE